MTEATPGVKKMSARFRAISTVFLLAWLSAQPAAGQPPTDAQATAPVTVAAPPGFRESCARYAWLCDSSPAAVELPADRLLALAHAVNRRVNGSVSQLSDAENYGTADYWTLPLNGRGDCEDFVLMKYRLLMEAGVGGQDLAVAVVLDRNGNNHAVLVLRHASGDLVLDSLRPEVMPWSETGYRFLAMQGSRDPSLWEVVADQPQTSPVLASR